MKKYTVVSYLMIMALLLTGCGLIRTRMLDPSNMPSAGNQTAGASSAPANTGTGQDSGTASADTTQNQDSGAASGDAGQVQTSNTMSGDAGQGQTPGTMSGDTVQGQTSSAVDLESAKATALRHAGLDASSVTFTKGEQDYDDGSVEYEIEFVTDTMRYEYEIRANDGMIKESSQEPIQQIAPNLQTQGLINIEDAQAAALAFAQVAADQAVYTDIEMDYDDGVTQYEIEFYAGGKEYSVTVNAANGEVLEMEID